nr:MAG TPA: hypothetical protein [Caudoviricetes sp.]
MLPTPKRFIEQLAQVCNLPRHADYNTSCVGLSKCNLQGGFIYGKADEYRGME